MPLVTKLVDRYDTVEPPVRLNKWGLELWSGKRVVVTDDGRVDKSKTLYAIASELYKRNLSPSWVVRYLEERDRILGYCKYTGRHDAIRQYQGIVSSVIATGSKYPAKIIPPGKECKSL